MILGAEILSPGRVLMFASDDLFAVSSGKPQRRYGTVSSSTPSQRIN
jgi:hypothetical protein